MRRSILCLVLGIALTTAPKVRASMIFDYVSTVNVATAPALPSNPPGFGAAVIAIGNGNSLTFNTNSATTIAGFLPGGADINFGNITFNPSGSTTVTPFAVNFNYEVTLTDQPSGQVGKVNFTGQVTGTALGSPHAINSTVLNYSVTPAVLNLGGSVYQISAKSATGPGSVFDGVLQGNITIVPEPVSIAMVGLAAAAGLVIPRRRRVGTSGI